jgi:hypothetical protein
VVNVCNERRHRDIPGIKKVKKIYWNITAGGRKIKRTFSACSAKTAIARFPNWLGFPIVRPDKVAWPDKTG